MKQSFSRTAALAVAAIAVTASAWGISTAVHHATGTLSAASAQQGPGGSEAANKYLAAQAKILLSLKPPLTDKQRADFKAMRDKNMAEGRARRAAGETPNPDPEARRKMGEDRRNAMRAQIAKILTPGQMKQYETQMKAYRKANPPQRRPN